MHTANYVRLHEKGELGKRAQEAKALLRTCCLCPHDCRADRLLGKQGLCRADGRLCISGAGPHLGEEDVLTGTNGSGTIFFSHCNLQCTFCQNYETSHLGYGQPVSTNRLADIMLSLQRRGCHNVNLVSPTHYVPPILEALLEAAERGLRLPLVYNSGGFDSLETLALLDGVVDIYMPDIKFLDEAAAQMYVGTDRYPTAVKAAIKEMHRQVGDLQLDEHGLATSGLLVRHLVMPGHSADSKTVMDFLAKEISPQTFVNVMGQYSPAHKAYGDATIGRRPTQQELSAARQAARDAGLRRVV